MMDVTTDEWRTDVINTEKELEAYHRLSLGHYALASLPETAEPRMHIFRARGYAHSATKCEEFLAKLKGMAAQFEEPSSD